MTRGCCFIAGEPKGDDTVFCNAPTVDGTWCRDHRAVVYMKRKPGAPAIEARDIDVVEAAAE